MSGISRGLHGQCDRPSALRQPGFVVKWSWDSAYCRPDRRLYAEVGSVIAVRGLIVSGLIDQLAADHLAAIVEFFEWFCRSLAAEGYAPSETQMLSPAVEAMLVRLTADEWSVYFGHAEINEVFDGAVEWMLDTYEGGPGYWSIGDQS